MPFTLNHFSTMLPITCKGITILLEGLFLKWTVTKCKNSSIP